MVIESFSYETTDLWNLSLSYDWWEDGAGPGESIQVDVMDGLNNETLAIHDPIDIPNFEVQNEMIDLPFWAEDNPGISIRFTIQSNSMDDNLYLDNIILSGNPVTIPNPPTAHAGPDLIVFDEITLDGSQSDDPDGTLELYEWQINHRENSDFDRTAYGEIVTISSLEYGFYDVTLTVTDDDGLTDTDEMGCAAIGKKGDLDFDGDSDGSDLAEFALNYGR